MTDTAEPNPEDVRAAQVQESDLLRQAMHAQADQDDGDHAAVEWFGHFRDVARGLFIHDIEHLPTERRIVTMALVAELTLCGIVFIDYRTDGPAKFRAAFQVAGSFANLQLWCRRDHICLGRLNVPQPPEGAVAQQQPLHPPEGGPLWHHNN